MDASKAKYLRSISLQRITFRLSEDVPGYELRLLWMPFDEPEKIVTGEPFLIAEDDLLQIVDQLRDGVVKEQVERGAAVQ